MVKSGPGSRDNRYKGPEDGEGGWYAGRRGLRRAKGTEEGSRLS